MRHRRCRCCPDVADVLRSPRPDTGIGILERRQQSWQRRTHVELRASIGKMPPAAAYDIQRDGSVAPHLRIWVAKRTRQRRNARWAERVQLVIDLLTFRLEGRQRGRRFLRAGLGVCSRKPLYRQRQIAQFRDYGVGLGLRVRRTWLGGGCRGRSRTRDQNGDSHGAATTNVQPSGADLLVLPLSFGSPAQAVMIALRCGSAGGSAGRLRGSNNTMSPGALDAAMQLRPLDLAR